eukprot:COSAG05_NODE_2111_length_3547_cov_3.036833_1_plen_107_part_10
MCWRAVGLGVVRVDAASGAAWDQRLRVDTNEDVYFGPPKDGGGKPEQTSPVAPIFVCDPAPGQATGFQRTRKLTWARSALASVMSCLSADIRTEYEPYCRVLLRLLA